MSVYRLSEEAYAARMAARARAEAQLVVAEVNAKDRPAPTLSVSTGPYWLVQLCRQQGLPEPLPEYRFHPQRKWRADYAWPVQKVIVEIEGAVWTRGRHTRGAGFVNDMEKYNAAALLGFYVLRYTPQQLSEALDDLRVMLA